MGAAAGAAKPKTDLRPLMFAGGAFGVIALIVLIIAVLPHGPPAPPAPAPAPAINTVPQIANTAPVTPATPPTAALEPPVGNGQETTPTGTPDTQAVTQYETEVIDGGPPATLPGAAVINTTQLVQSMTDRDTGNSPFWLIDARGCDGEVSIPTAVCFAGQNGTQQAPNFQVMIAALEAKIPDKKATLVFFCHNGGCPYSYNLASQAIDAGYENVFWYRGGINAWTSAAMPTVASAQAIQ